MKERSLDVSEIKAVRIPQDYLTKLYSAQKKGKMGDSVGYGQDRLYAHENFNK